MRSLFDSTLSVTTDKVSNLQCIKVFSSRLLRINAKKMLEAKIKSEVKIFSHVEKDVFVLGNSSPRGFRVFR